jgi:hypothetical protein
MDNASLISTLRTLYGVDPANYSDSFLTSQISRSVQKISQYYPEIETSYITTVKDQTRYTVTHTGLIKVKYVYYNQGETYNDIFSTLEWDERYHTSVQISTFASSRSYELIQRLKLIRELYPSQGDIVSYNKFDLLPTPIQDGIKVYYDYEKFRDVTTTPDIFEEDVFALVFYYLGEKEFQKFMVSQSGNKYFFERRGNVQVNDSEQKMQLEVRKDQLGTVLKSIKEKVMKL